MLQVGETYANMGDPVDWPWRAIESHHLLRTWECVGRVPRSPVWFRFVMELGSGEEHARFWLFYGTSNTEDPKTDWQIPSIRLLTRGSHIWLRDSDRKQGARKSTDHGSDVTLMTAQKWGEGEAQACRGLLIFANAKTRDMTSMQAALQYEVAAVSPDWSTVGAFGPWGYVPPLPPGWDRKQSEARALADWRKQTANKDPWAQPLHGCFKVPSLPGDQPDFSAMTMTEEANGFPARILPVRRSVAQEFCRPIFLRDEEGGHLPIAAMRNLHFWDGQLFFTSPNKLGKADTNFSNPHGFRGHDRQHTSLNYGCELALLTADRTAMELVRWHAELWQQTNPGYVTGNATIDGQGAERAVGRTMALAAKLWLLTDRDDLRRAANFRIGVVNRQWTGRASQPVQPGTTYGKGDTRNLYGLYPFIMPWQQAIGARGLDAWASVDGSEMAQQLADAWARNCFDYGVFSVGGRWRCSKAVEWKNGGRWGGRVDWQSAPSSVAQSALAGWYRANNPPRTENYVEYYDPYLIWYAPGLIVARRAGVQPDDITEALQQVSLDPSGPNYWRNTEWLAVR